MHALQWIEQHGRYRRTISAGALRKALGRQKRQCTWCGQEVPPHRQTWCSAACVEAFQLRCQPQAIVRHIERTRPLVCEGCGLDLGALIKLGAKIGRSYDVAHWDRLPDGCVHFMGHYNRRGRRNQRRVQRLASLGGYAPYACKFEQWLARRGLTGYWEADHIVPVCEGGGLCGPENYRILCIPCHRGVTKELARRRAKRKATT